MESETRWLQGVVQVDLYTPIQEDLIVIRFRLDRDRPDLIRSVFEHMREVSPNNRVAVLPGDMSLKRMRTRELLQLRDQINTLLEAERT